MKKSELRIIIKEEISNILENSMEGWGNDPNKPKKIQSIENKVNKWVDSLKRGRLPGWNESPVLNRLRREWDEEVERAEKEGRWKAKYNFGDVLA